MSGIQDWNIDELKDKVKTMNDALHLIQIIASTMEDNEQVREIFEIADKAQLD